MPAGKPASILRQLRQAVGLSALSDSADGALLERFVEQRDEAAFEALVRRHGPLVLGVCRRMLVQPQDVEDAFQTTFFIFVRKASSIARGKAVGSWLYRVAYRTAVKVRHAAARRRTRESPLENQASVPTPSSPDGSELRLLLDDAVNALPERYRRPIVLCYLEGKSNEEAARELGCPVGTVWAQLNRARERLQALLTRRGVTVPGLILTTVLEQATVSAAVPPELLNSTVRGGLLLASGEAAAVGGFAPSIVALAREVTRGLVFQRLQTAALVLAAFAVLAGSSLLTLQTLAERPLATQSVSHAALPAPSAKASSSQANAQAVAAFTKVHQLVKPQPGESRWMEIPWLTSVWEARRRAAMEGKPIYLIVAGMGSPLGPCNSTGRLCRVPSLWTEEHVRLVNDRFIPVAADAHVLMTRQDAEGAFIREVCGLRFSTRSYAIVCLTADGKQLGTDARTAWEAFQTVAEEARRPGAVVVDDLGPVDTRVAPPAPPPGGLILKLYARPLARDAAGGLRHALGPEFPSANPKCVDDYLMLGAAPDFLWLKQEEWQSLIPASPCRGERFPVAAAIAQRIFCCHLVPGRIHSTSSPWPAAELRAGELNLTVEEVSPESICLRLDGFAHLGEPYDPTRELDDQKVGYEARLTGFLHYDVQRKAITRFDMVAVGDVYGKLPDAAGGRSFATRPGRQPLGFAFELVRGDVPANGIPPTGKYRSDYFSGR